MVLRTGQPGAAEDMKRATQPLHQPIDAREPIVPSYATRLFRLTLLAPDIVSAILSGKHPPELTARRLMDDTRLPLEWNEQRQRLECLSSCVSLG